MRLATSCYHKINNDYQRCTGGSRTARTARWAVRKPFATQLIVSLIMQVCLIVPIYTLTACAAKPQAAAPLPLPTAHIAVVSNAPARIEPDRLPPFAATPTIAPTATLQPTQPPPTSQPTAVLAWPREQPPADVAAVERALAEAMNAVRAQNNLPAYTFSPELAAAARAHSCDLAAHSLISHTSTDGRTLVDRLAGATPPWQWPSESIAAGLSDVEAVVAAWMDEPPQGWHRRNILDPEQHEVGVGYCYAADDPSGNHHYWTADFARR